jgi:hypothetical protein
MKSCKLRYFNLFEFFDCTGFHRITLCSLLGLCLISRAVKQFWANFRVFVRIRPQLFASKSYVLTETVVKKQRASIRSQFGTL